MKILFVQKEGGIFGAENYQLKVIPGLLAQGIQIEFLRLFTDYQGGVGGEFIKRLQKFGVTTHEVNIGKYPTLRVLKQVQKVANKGDYDLVHTHLIHADFHLALIKQFFGLKPVLVSTKHGYDNEFTSKYGFEASKQTKTLYYLISRWAERRMKASFTISHGLRNFFIETGLSNSDKMQLIHYGFDLPEHFKLKGEQKYRLASKQIIIVGRLVAFKGHRYLIEAMALLKQIFGSEVKLLIAGTGPLDNELRAQVNSLDLVDSVVFLGYSKSVGAFMANSDVVAIPSISEGFGVVFLEAFAAKTPIVSWNVPAGNELMDHGRTGYLVPPYDVNALVDQLIEILNGLDKQGHITQQAYEHLKNYFNSSRMIKETVEFYENTLSS